MLAVKIERRKFGFNTNDQFQGRSMKRNRDNYEI